MFRIIHKNANNDYNNKQMKPRIYPKTQERLALMGEQIKLARLRRGLSASLIAERAGVSRTTVYMIEKGNPRISLGAIAAVLSSIGGMDEDLLAIGRDDIAGRTYQDLHLKIKKKGSR
jgi:transcriptional regulator with XRE-family HTH domain